jgi:hypothetical protein
MHRSGTSALTGLLRQMGLWAGETGDFPPPDEHNRAGYWEHLDVWAVDEALLQALGASWSEVADLDLSRLDEPLRAAFVERARDVLRDLDRHGSWVVKDPRLCLLLPFWRDLLERPFCLLIHREPLAVARSLAARDGLPIPHGLALWETYTRQALAASRGLPRALVSHRELMADPVATLHRLHGELVRQRPELAHLRVPEPAALRAALDPALVHQAHEPELERLYLTPPQSELLAALADGSALDLDPVPPLSPGARDLLAAYRNPESLRALARDLQHRLAAQTETAENLQRRLTAQTETGESLQRDLAARTESAESLQRRLAARTETAESLRQALDELDTLFSALLESRSWKIGRAITAARRFLGQSQISASERRDRLMAAVRRRTRPPGQSDPGG